MPTTRSRPLTRREDWTAALGRKVNVRLRSGDSETVLEGRLLALVDDGAEIEVSERRRARVVPIALADVLAARIAVDI